jgi:hypothetical protein
MPVADEDGEAVVVVVVVVVVVEEALDVDETSLTTVGVLLVTVGAVLLLLKGEFKLLEFLNCYKIMKEVSNRIM